MSNLCCDTNPSWRRQQRRPPRSQWALWCSSAHRGQSVACRGRWPHRGCSGHLLHNSSQPANRSYVWKVNNCYACGKVSNYYTCGKVSNYYTCGKVNNLYTCGKVNNFYTCGKVSNYYTCGKVNNCHTCGKVNNFHNNNNIIIIIIIAFI